jgi:hypothetical protein
MAGANVTLDDMRRLIRTESPRKKEVEIAEAQIDDEGKIKVYNSTIEKLGEEVRGEAVKRLKPVLVETITRLTTEAHDKLSAEIIERDKNLRDDVLALAETVRPIVVKTKDKNTILKGVQHAQFENLLTIVGTGQPVLMVGPAGTGKTHGAALAAEALGLSFHSISVGSQTSKSDLQGYLDANHNYVRTQFREAYEGGGVFLLDEADAGNSNVLILLNAALSNGYMAFPDGMVHMHEDFRMIATANTYGHGASRQYVGRNQLDAATLDRFAVLTWDIDAKVENALAGGHKKWLNTVRAVRKKVVDELELRVVVSPRATQRGAILLTAGMNFEDVLEIALIGNMPKEHKQDLANLARAAYNKEV